MERVVIVVVVALVMMGVSWWFNRQRPEVPTRTGYDVPDQVDRADFNRPDAEWLVAVFTSATCSSCSKAWTAAAILESDVVAVQEIEVEADKALHDRYRIEGVPIIVVADSDGVVRRSFVGPPTATDLWAALAELREPGSVPEGCASHQEPSVAGDS